MAISRIFRSDAVRKASVIVALPVGLALTLHAGLAIADPGPTPTRIKTTAEHREHPRTTSPPPSEPPGGNGEGNEPGSGESSWPGEGSWSPSPSTAPSSQAPTTSSPPTTGPTPTEPGPTGEPSPKPGTPSPSPTPTNPPPTSPRPSSNPPSPQPSPTTAAPSTTRPPTAETHDVGISRRIALDPATGVGTIPFTVGNTTGKPQPARDVYAFSTSKLEILAIPGCVRAPALASGWRDSFRCALPALAPGESRSFAAQVRYLPATEQRPGSGGAGRSVPHRLPLVDAAADVSTFTVVVVPKAATNLSVILGQDGPLRLVYGSNDPNVIGFTIAPGEGAPRSAGATPAANSGTGNGSNNAPLTPPALPTTGVVPFGLSLAGGAFGLLLVGFSLVQITRFRSHPNSTA